MSDHENMAPGQQNFSKTDKQENFKNALPGKEILAGAQQEDQLEKFKSNADEQRSEDADNEEALE